MSRISKAQQEPRSTKIASMFLQGLTMEKIGQQFRISRERVRQILKLAGLSSAGGGKSLMTAIKRDQAILKKQAQCQIKYGVSLEVLQQLRADGVTSAYTRQKQNASIRGIGWNLEVRDWLAIWRTSGKLHLRGRGKGKYVMSRIRDDGPYEIGNVHIQLATENSRDAVDKWRGKEKANKGVFLLYPGRDRAWFAKVGKHNLGFFVTEADAAQARADYLAANPPREPKVRHKSTRKVRGYYQIRNGGFAAYAHGKYLGYFRHEQEAIEARAKALELVKEAA